MPVFVTGCHRSGTSLLASLLVDALGLERGTDLEVAIDNPRGFFESRQLMEFNDRLLAIAGGDWCHPPLLPPPWGDPDFFQCIEQERSAFSSYSLSSFWIDKDPRLCITLPAFKHLLLRRVPVVAALRSPLEVAISLYYRNGFPLESSLALWFLYNHHLSRYLGPADQIVPYSLLASAADPHHGHILINRLQPILSRHFGLELPFARWHEIFLNRVEPSLHRACVDTEYVALVNPGLLALLDDLYLSACADVQSFRSVFSSLPLPVLDLLDRYPILASAELNSLRLERQQLREQITALHQSRSWQLTAPLRWLSSRRG